LGAGARRYPRTARALPARGCLRLRAQGRQGAGRVWLHRLPARTDVVAAGRARRGPAAARVHPAAAWSGQPRRLSRRPSLRRPGADAGCRLPQPDACDDHATRGRAAAPRTGTRRPSLHPADRPRGPETRAQGPPPRSGTALAGPGQRRCRPGHRAARLAAGLNPRRTAQACPIVAKTALQRSGSGQDLHPPPPAARMGTVPSHRPGVPMHALTGHRAGFQPHPAPSAPAPSNVLADEHTGLQHVLVTRHPHFGGQLFLDDDLQISESDTAYGVAMTSPLLELERPARVAILGGGDGGVLNELLRTFAPLDAVPSELTMVEIDRRVMELSREHLPAVCGDAFDSPHANIVVGDAFAWIAQARDLDAVIYDLTMDPVREGQSRADFISGIVAHMARA